MDSPENQQPDGPEAELRWVRLPGQPPEDTVLFEVGLAELFNKHPASIKRAVERGKLPPPTRLFGKSVWTTRAIVGHIAQRLAAEAGHERRMRGE